MPQVINVTNDEIAYSERILLPEGKVFDTERRTFICNFETIDLQAVPGSGKTTALLAKLLILEKKLPFDDGSGILVISHTNAAIDEIKVKIQKHCPKLFSYPNFIGTIQSFVDEFLASPFYLNQFKYKPYRIDNEIHSEYVSNYYHKSPNVSLKNWLGRKADPIGFLKDIRLDINGNIISKITGTVENFELKNKELPVYKALHSFKINQIKKGILNFEDAYTLANFHLHKIPSYHKLLQKRFRFVFVDEMQDMDRHQYDLLEKIFFDGGNSLSIYQRIGDKNQSIFNGDAKVEIYWIDRNIVLPLNGSQRLTPSVANVVNNFALYHPAGFGIVGLCEGTIKPHIIKYSNSSIHNVIPTFLKKILELKELPENIVFKNRLKELNSDGKSKYPIKVLAWNAIWKTQEEKDDVSKVRLVDYFQSFNKEDHKPKTDYLCLKSYLLYYDKNKKTLSSIRNNILNAFLRILRFEDISDADGRYFTKKSFIDWFKLLSENTHDNKYETFKLNIYNWSMGIIKGSVNEVFDSIVNYTPELLNIFEKQVNKSQIFLNNNLEDKEDNEVRMVSSNKYNLDGLEAEITTIHSVKGQTHSATLYLESSYYEQHETERLSEQFLDIKFNDRRVRHKESTKMAYVGLSRPTDLLCFAVHNDRFNQYLDKLNLEEWEVIEAD